MHSSSSDKLTFKIGGEIMLELSDRKWAEFKLDRLFNIKNGKVTTIDKEGTTYPVVSACTTNNAVIGYSDDATNLLSGGRLTIGQQTAYCSYQENDFIATNNVVILYWESNIGRNVGLFFAAMINLAINGKFNYGRKLSAGRTADVIISLPFNDAGQPDYDFMEQYIAERSPDYSWAKGCIEPDAEISLSDRDWGEFKLKDLFVISGSKNYNKNMIEPKDFLDKSSDISINYVTRSKENNGVSGYIANNGYIAQEGNALTIGIEGMVCFYQGEPFVCGTNITVLRSKYLNPYTGLFFVNCINTASQGLYSYGARGFTLGRVKEQIIHLPIKADGTPDYDFMERYMKSLPFSKVLE